MFRDCQRCETQWRVETRATVGLVLGFRSSSNLAGAYGVAVTTTMVITTLLAFICSRRVWGWRLVGATFLTVLLLVPDLAFFGANLVKIPQGGWFPLAVAVIVYVLMTTWKRGRELLAQRLTTARVTSEQFLESLKHHSICRVQGTSVFMDSNTSGVPRSLLHNIKHNQVLHNQVLLVTMLTDEVPRLVPAERLEVTELQPGFLRVASHWGYMEHPNLPEVLTLLRTEGIVERTGMVSIYLGRETLIVTQRPGMSHWRKHLFALVSRNAQGPTLHFGIPPGQVVELGLQVEL